MSIPAPAPAPEPGEVHVWWIDLERMPDDARAVLSLEERARADRFRQSRDRARWTGARAALRQILARYIGSSPEDVRFIPPSPGSTGEGGRGVRVYRDTKPSPETRKPLGKPRLAGGSPFCFSLTHAGPRAALAVAWAREVGIDLEPLDAQLDVRSLLAVACTPAETARLEALPPAERVEAFLTLWTLKEAYLKATGAGLFREPRSFGIELVSRDRAILHDPLPGTDAQRWSLHLLDPGPGWVAALAVAGAAPVVTVFAWPPDPKT